MANTILQAEHAGAVLGVDGRFFNVIGENGAATFRNQKWIGARRPIKGYGKGAHITPEIRFDDECNNGKNSFTITAHVSAPGARDWLACGCLHEDIVAVFPTLAPLIKWHLFDASGPMHYVSNTVYLAGNRECWGTLKGQPRQFETRLVFGDNPITHKLPQKFMAFLESAAPHNGRAAYDFEGIAVDYVKSGATDYAFGPKYAFGGFGARWHECPFDSEAKALEFLGALQHCNPRFVKIATAFGEGKDRQLDAARRSAVWPEASDEILCSDKATLTAALEARLPALIEAFRRDIEAAGFLWAPSTISEV